MKPKKVMYRIPDIGEVVFDGTNDTAKFFPIAGSSTFNLEDGKYYVLTPKEAIHHRRPFIIGKMLPVRVDTGKMVIYNRYSLLHLYRADKKLSAKILKILRKEKDYE